MTCLVFIHTGTEFADQQIADNSTDLQSLILLVESFTGLQDFYTKKLEDQGYFKVGYPSLQTTVLKFDTEAHADAAIAQLETSAYGLAEKAYYQANDATKVAIIKKYVF